MDRCLVFIYNLLYKSIYIFPIYNQAPLYHTAPRRINRISYINIRKYSNKANSHSHSLNNNLNFDPDKDKVIVLDLCKNKSGIYMWTNKFNNKRYIGSSVDLRRRLLEYYNINRLLKETSMAINRSLLKHGYSSFTLSILEFCDKNSLMSKEKYYFDLYSPEYNILTTPGSPSRGSGWKHSEATIEKFKSAAINRFKSAESRNSLSLAHSSGIKVKVKNIKTNTETIYPSIKNAARFLGLDSRYIYNYIHLHQDKPVLDNYTFELFDAKDIKPNVTSQKNSMKVQVIDIKTDKIREYSSIGAAARDLGIRQASISLYLKENRNKPFKGIYLFKLLS